MCSGVRCLSDLKGVDRWMNKGMDNARLFLLGRLSKHVLAPNDYPDAETHAGL